MNDIASRYGSSLFSLANDANEVLLWQTEAKEIIRILTENPSLISLLNNEFLSLDERYEVIGKCFSSCRKEFVSLMKLVVKNHRARWLVDIFKAFNSEANIYRGVKEGLLYTARPIDEKTKVGIEKSVSQKEGCLVELSIKIDPSLIGGIKVVINNHIYDSSISYKLTQMKINLMKQGG